MKNKQTANLSIQMVNRTNIFQLLRRYEGLTRLDIVQQLQLSLPTVVNNINNLQMEGLIREEGFVGHTGGRRARTYSIVKNARTAIGLDITKNQIIAVAVDLTGEIIGQSREQYQFERSDKYYEHLGGVIENLIKTTSLDEKNILGVGFGVPGLATADNQTIFYGEILKFTGATCKEFSKYIPYKSALFNDAKAACIAELWLRRNSGDAFYILLSNNVGGAMVINNQMHMGSHFHSGEIGHITLYPDGKLCYCGQKGCTDPYLAATILSSLSNGNLEEFFQLLEKKDSTAVKTWDNYLDALALAVNTVQDLFDCKIILGGYVGEYLEKYIDEIKNRAAKLNSFEKDAEYLDVCRYKTNSIAAGAALNFISNFLDSI
jgi:predicted NBD/HSP70 family sugar kinase